MENPLLKKLALFPYYLLLLLGLTLPSDGSHGFKNPKSLAFLWMSLGFVWWIIFRGHLQSRSLWLLGIGALYLLFFLSSFAWALWNPETPLFSSFDQWKLIVITLVVTGVTYLLYWEGDLPFQQFLKVLVYGNFVYTLGKLFFVVQLFLGGSSLEEWGELTGFRIMTMDLGNGFIRFQTSLDMVTPFLTFFVLERKRWNLSFPKGFVLFYLPLSFLSVVLSFTRVLIFVLLFSWVLYFFSGSLKRGILGLLFSFVLMGGLISVVGWNPIWTLVEKRLFSRDNAESDAIRKDQIHALSYEIERRPLLGKGVGGFSPQLVRDEDNPHSYEVQWVAFWAQFGFLGIFFFFSTFFLMVFPAFSKGLHRIPFCIALLFLGWLLSGLTNPFMISLTSGIMYPLFGMALSENIYGIPSDRPRLLKS